VLGECEWGRGLWDDLAPKNGLGEGVNWGFLGIPLRYSM
jgi:hypothetical protein